MGFGYARHAGELLAFGVDRLGGSDSPDLSRLSELAADLVDRKVAVTVALSDPAALAAKRATSNCLQYWY